MLALHRNACLCSLEPRTLPFRAVISSRRRKLATNAVEFLKQGCRIERGSVHPSLPPTHAPSRLDPLPPPPDCLPCPLESIMMDMEQLFKKQVDKLQTDHQGTFVLKDSNFRWTSRYAEGG